MKAKVRVVIIIFLVCFMGLISCKFSNNGDGVVWTTVDFSLDRLTSKVAPPQMATAGTVTSLIIAVPASTTSVNIAAYISSDDFDQQLLNITDGTVTLTVPVNTSIRLVKLNFSSDLTLEQILTQLPEPINSGISDAFVIVGDDTEKSIVIAMTTGGSSGPIQMGEGIQGITLNLSGTVTTFAGQGAFGSTNHSSDPLQATFYGPHDIATDGTFLFIADKFNELIRMIVIATGEVTTLAGGNSGGGTPCIGSNNSNCKDGTGTVAQFYQPAGLTVHDGFLYIADQQNHRIRRVRISDGEVTTFAGEGTGDFLDGASGVAKFWAPTGITSSPTSLFLADMYNCRIREIVISTGDVSTLAGDGSCTDFTDPHDVTTNGTSVFVANLGRHVINQIVISSGTVSILVGTSGTNGYQDSTDGTSTGVLLQEPEGITMDDTFIYFTDHGTDTTYSQYYTTLVRRVEISTGNTITLAGSGTGGGGVMCTGDNTTNCYDGTGDDAQFLWAHDLAIDGNYLYLADFNNDRIRRIE